MYNRKSIFSVCSIAIFVFGIGLTTLGSVAPSLKEKFNLDEIASGSLFSFLPLGILAGSLLFGPVADRYGYKLLLTLACVCMFAGFEGIAFADSILVLKMSVLLFGLGGGAINGGTSAVVSDISKSKGTALSLLGVFYGLGALSMPFFLGLLKNVFSAAEIIAAVGLLSLIAGCCFLVLNYPPAKQKQGFKLAGSLPMLKDRFLLTIAFFLFCQSSFEGIINNWTTSYFIQYLSIGPEKALYALTLHLAGITVSRLLIGTVFKSMKPRMLLFLSFVLIFSGCLLLSEGNSYALAVAGLVVLGAGLGGGFPIMLGYVGNRYAQLSGTAFSFVLVIALIGNMLINYLMGIIAQEYGIQHLITLSFIELAVMIILCATIFKKL